MNVQHVYMFVTAICLASATIMNNPIQIFISGVVIAMASFKAGEYETRSNATYTASHKEEQS